MSIDPLSKMESEQASGALRWVKSVVGAAALVGRATWDLIRWGR